VIVGVSLLAPGPIGQSNPIEKGKPAPEFAGTTLDGAPLALADLRGRPVIINFWGPSCLPCRDEFPLFLAKLAEHRSDDFAIVGVLMGDAPAPARDFIAAYGATWPTVDDPDGSIRAAYRVIARPMTFFIDQAGILRGYQIGQVIDTEFERQYALISGPAGSVSP
jgi:cytochrome c biogenesis protein CcmG/thiol:disulfide interchange protein DsbE